MGERRVRFKCATAVRLCAIRAMHIRHTFAGSAHVPRRLEKLRHLASVRLTCMHTTGERGDWKLKAPTPNRETADEEEAWSMRHMK